MNVLIIEDEAKLLRKLVTDLTALNYTIVGTATSVEEAMQVIHRTPEIEMAIVDIGLVGHKLGGIAVAKYLQSIYAQIAIIFLTVHGKGKVQDKALNEVLPTYYLEKPYFPNALETALRISSKLRMHIPKLSPNKATIVGLKRNIREAVSCYLIKWIALEHEQLRAYLAPQQFYEITDYTSLDKLMKDYKQVFVKINQSYAVNLWQVYRMEGDTKSERQCYLQGTAQPLPISRRLFSTVKKQWLAIHHQ